jgi:hypothetical protein
MKRGRVALLGKLSMESGLRCDHGSGVCGLCIIRGRCREKSRGHEDEWGGGGWRGKRSG